MAKNVSRVNGRNGESMWSDEEELLFRTNGKTRKMKVSNIETLDILNAGDARALVENTELIPHGAWTEDMTSSKGKSNYVVATDEDNCWVMEITKNQSPNALTFVRSIKPQEKTKAEDYKLYAAIQTPLGGVFALGSIVCVFAAVYFVYSAQIPLLGLLFAIAGIIMFTRVK